MASEKQGILERWRQRARQLKLETYTLYLAYGDPRVAWYAKAFAALVVAYAFSPIDLIPDFIPLLGYLDDLILIPLGVALAIKMIPPLVLEEKRQMAREHLSQGRPTNWVAAIVIGLIWLVGLTWLVFFIYKQIS